MFDNYKIIYSYHSRHMALHSDIFIYIHIPYCRSRCTYCDFVTFEEKNQIPIKEYLEILKKEIRSKAHLFQMSKVQSVYFGGGTPSLLPAKDLMSILEVVQNNYQLKSETEITIEMNPDSFNEDQLNVYKQFGVNRFSLGVQTFNSWFLEKSKRFHSVEDSFKALELLRKEDLNFSLDLMFGLPHQTLADLKMDVIQSLQFDPPHISLYNLTIPPQHELAQNRPSEDKQCQMFTWIEQELLAKGLKKYEISNFAKPNKKSRHNLAYWEGKTVLGFGLSAHSYLSPHLSSSFCENVNNPYGIRFWNSSKMAAYFKQIQDANLQTPFCALPTQQVEFLTLPESLTDFCYTRLRTKKGLSLKELKSMYPSSIFNQTHSRLNHLEQKDWLEKDAHSFRLTSKGEILSNQVFLDLTFSQKDFKFLNASI